jgi:prepilin-type N-terminal cleavage/methylation domain-containing protein
MSATGSGRGFTLLELLVVIATLTLMSVAVPLTLNRVLPARRLAIATDHLVADIQWLQAQSTALGKVGQLELRTDGYELRVLASDRMRSVTLPARIRVKAAASAREREAVVLRVHPEGTTSGAQLEVADARGSHQVFVSVMTGRVTRARAS